MKYKHIKLTVLLIIKIIDYISLNSEGIIKVDIDYKMPIASKTTRFITSDHWFKLKLRSILLFSIFILLLIFMAVTYNIYM